MRGEVKSVYIGFVASKLLQLCRGQFSPNLSLFKSLIKKELFVPRKKANKKETNSAKLGFEETLWQAEDIPGFCKSAELKDIRGRGYVLTPGRYVGAEEMEDDDEPFEDKMERLTQVLQEQFAESAKLEAEIKQNLRGLGYELIINNW